MLNQLIDKINDAKRALDSRSEDDCTGAGRLEKFWNLLSKGFNSAGIIVDSLEKFVPGLSFVGELLKQTKNWVPKLS